jgi:Nif-specific regulatory protein
MSLALETNKLANLSTVLLTQLDEKFFFSELSRYFSEHMKIENVQIYMAHQDGSTRLIAQNGQSVESALLAKGLGLSGYVARMKRAYYSNSVKRDPLATHGTRADNIEAECAIPVIAEGVVIATIHLQTSQKVQFGEAEVTLVQEVLNQIQAPIRNMRLLMSAMHLNRELQSRLEKQQVELPSFKSEIQTGKQSDERINIVGISKVFTDMVQVAKKLASQDFPIYIEGAHGTGKKILARKIHFWSHRKDKSCVLIHCQAQSEAAIDLELFGKKGKPGALAQANNGTIILDGVSSLPMNVQAKLLRMMITGEAISADMEEVSRLNVRLIALSKDDLSEKVKKGEFKEELYYRLNTMSIKTANLKERKEDIKVLAENFLNMGKSQEQAKILTHGALQKLNDYFWPGNIQELRNLMERSSAIVEGRYIDETHLPELKSEVIEEVKVEAPKFTEMALFDLEKKHIIDTLDHLNGNKTRAAKSLGITVKTLYNKLHSYGLIDTKAE